MPNLKQLVNFKDQYGQLNKQDRLLKVYLNDFEKGFDYKHGRVVEHFDHTSITPSLIEYFESKPTEDVVLLFIDISNFSTLTSTKSSDFLAEYLDDYYSVVFPIIYSYGGQIEKVMGDGIICMFGKPFLDVSWPVEFNRAELCSKSLIYKFRNTNKEVKIALHSGEVKYYKTPGTEYEEYTMIGKPITELFRLESISRVNAINFYGEGIYSAMRPSSLGLSKIKSEDVRSYTVDIDLRGVKYSQLKYIRFKDII